jgi:spermidine/putrescine transport system substrate-binding protein
MSEHEVDPEEWGSPRTGPARLGRRDFLRLMGVGAGALGGSALLSACGVSGQKQAQPSGSALKKTATDFWTGKQQTGSVNWAQWPLYIDVGAKKSDHPSIDQFTKATSIKVKYYEVIQGDDSFFAKVQPSLSAGQYTGYDIATITNGIYFDKFRQLGYFIPLDQARLKNFKQYAADAYKHSSYDPGNVYSVPWQSGITGIAYDATKVPKAITSFNDLFDSRLKGKVGMFADNQDLPNATLVAMFGDPQKTGPDQWRQAADKLKKQRDKGIVRKYYEQDYIDAISKGDIWACQAWSGDVFQALASGAKHLKFVIPSEGGVLWTDNLVLLKGIKHPVDAMELIDFYYQPKIAAEVAEWVNYITPVPTAQQVVMQDAAAAKGSDKAALQQLAHSPLVFPTQSDYAKLHRYRTLTNDELRTWNSIFEPIYQS